MATGARPFRFGVQLTGAPDTAGWKEQVRRAEALGYHVLLMPDHVRQQFAIGPALAIAAEVTSTLRLGTLVWQNDWRHPALAAQEAVTLDILSGGRFELGIGAGGSIPGEYRRTGIPFAPPRERVGRLYESVGVLKGLMTEETFSFAGEHYTFTEYAPGLTPVQRPHPPLLIAGGGPRMLRLAAREADIVGLLPLSSSDGGFDEVEVSMDGYAAKIDLVRHTAGERFPEIELNVLVHAMEVTDDRDAGVDVLRRTRGMTSDAWFDSPSVYVGSVAEIADRLREVRERLGVSYFVVYEWMMEACAPVIAALTGE